MAKNFMSAMMNTKASTPQPIYSQTEKVKKEITILESIKRFIPPLSTEEKQQLEQNILEFGCKDPLTIWETNRGVIDAKAEQPEEIVYILIDGHNRYEICQKFGVDFKISVVEFENFDQIHDFMIDHQLGRRNLSSEQMSYLRGLKYNALKKNDVQRDKNGKFLSDNSPSGQNDQTVNLVKNTNEKSGVEETENAGHLPSGQNDQTVKRASLSEQLAEQFNVGEKTIRRDADFAKGLDLLPIEVRNEVLQGKSNLNKAAIIEIGKNKDAEKIGESVLELLGKVEKGNNIDKKKEAIIDRRKEKIVSLAKTMNSVADCDRLIVLINEYKRLHEK